MSKKVVDAKADPKGNITAVRLEGNSTFTPLDTAINMARQGKIENAHAVTHPGGDYLRTNPDGKVRNNLDEMAGDKK
jgi:hypothetical protein